MYAQLWSSILREWIEDTTFHFTKQQLDTPLADLQQFGLSTRVLNMLERYAKIVYVKDLVGVDFDGLTTCKGMEDHNIQMLRSALGRWYNEQRDGSSEE